MQLRNGSRLGPYEIVAKVGAGGMGEVYRGRDTRLGRAVAIKILPAEFANDPKYRQRLNREAKAISSLNHPHVCALYDVGEANLGDSASLHYLVMEYVEGETLEQKLTSGRLPLESVIRFGAELAAALDAAHQRGILHRDVKPSNVIITRAGAKLLDFGLAKPLESFRPSGGDLSADSDSSTEDKSLTTNGQVIGTIDHMAPEVLEGEEPDARSDIFALGVVLYRMATGRRPFAGPTRASTIAAILQRDPVAISQLQPQSPPSFDWLVQWCLAKDRRDRIQSAHDVKLELNRIAELELNRPFTARHRRTRFERLLPWAAAAFLAITTVAGVFLWRSRGSGVQKQTLRRFSIVLPEAAPLAAGNFVKFAVSPDGQRIVYTAAGEPTRLYLYSVETGEARPLPNTETARNPFFSPDSQWIGFFTADGELRKMSLADGAQVTLSTGRDLRGASWSTDGAIVFAEPWSPLGIISDAGGRPDLLTPRNPTANVRWPAFLDPDHVLYTASDFSGDYENARLAVVSRSTRRAADIVSRAAIGRYAAGHLVYLHSDSLFAIPFDRRSRKVTGTAKPVVGRVDSYFAAGLAHFDVASDGSLFYVARDLTENQSELVWVDRTGTVTPVSAVNRAFDEPKISPDGRKLVVTIGSGPGSDLWIYDISRENWTRLTTEGTNRAGIWSPDGKQIVFSSNRERGFNLFVVRSDGSGPPVRITNRTSWPFPTSWSPDGSRIAVVEQHPHTSTDIFVIIAEGGEGKPLLSTRFSEADGVFSPNGKWIAYESNESGRPEVFVQDLTDGRKELVSASGGSMPVWRRDGRELFYRSGKALYAVAVDKNEFGRPHVLFEGEFGGFYDVTPDGSRFLMIRRPRPASTTQINVVLGLF